MGIAPSPWENDTHVSEDDRLVSAGRRIGDQDNKRLIAELILAAGVAISGSKPLAENLGYIAKTRFVGMTGQAVLQYAVFCKGQLMA